MELTEYRASASEQERVADLMRLLQPHTGSALDIGARDGFISSLLADRFDKVIALDLAKPDIADQRIVCVAGNLMSLDFPDRSVSSVLCAEVLEHIPSDALARACAELARVATASIVVGVPYRQDIRLGCCTCNACGALNPPWGHVNSFDEAKLSRLFPDWRAAEWSYVGSTRERTNFLSAWLMDLAGNPYGTYAQEEHCIHCGQPIGSPQPRSLGQKVATRVAWEVTRVQQRLGEPRAKWVHVRFVPK